MKALSITNSDGIMPTGGNKSIHMKAPKLKIKKETPSKPLRKVKRKFSNGGEVEMTSLMPEKNKVIGSNNIVNESDYDNRPEITFNENQLPQIKDWKVGENYCLILEVSQNGTRICYYGDMKGKVEATFKIDKVGVCDSEGEQAEGE